jgi:hypothetical protein
MADEQNTIEERLGEQFKNLPKVVQDAITSADVQKHLRELADTQKLHLDQWQALENEVMLALLGFQPPEDLAKNIKSEVGVSDDIAAALAAGISKIVFEPIRQELERQLEHPEAKAEQLSDVETARRSELSKEPPAGEAAAPATPAAVPVLPATPPAPGPTERAARAPLSSAYKAGEPSTVRASVDDDPYREPPT